MRETAAAALAWTLLHCMSLSLALLGFPRTLGITNRLAPDSEAETADDDAVQGVIQAIGRAKRWHLRMTAEDCLPVALVGMFMLRRQGVQADLVLGVQTFPFQAHAWVQSDQRIIDFPPDKYKNFSGVTMTRRVKEAHAHRPTRQG